MAAREPATAPPPAQSIPPAPASRGIAPERARGRSTVLPVRAAAAAPRPRVGVAVRYPATGLLREAASRTTSATPTATATTTCARPLPASARSRILPVPPSRGPREGGWRVPIQVIKTRRTRDLPEEDRQKLFGWGENLFGVLPFDLSWRTKDWHVLAYDEGAAVAHAGVLRHDVLVTGR